MGWNSVETLLYRLLSCNAVLLNLFWLLDLSWWADVRTPRGTSPAAQHEKYMHSTNRHSTHSGCPTYLEYKLSRTDSCGSPRLLLQAGLKMLHLLNTPSVNIEPDCRDMTEPRCDPVSITWRDSLVFFLVTRLTHVYFNFKSVLQQLCSIVTHPQLRNSAVTGSCVAVTECWIEGMWLY